MCNTNISELTSLISKILIFIIPIIYIILYEKSRKKKKNKHWNHALLVGFIIFIILLALRFIILLLPVKCNDCYLNNNCEITTTDSTTSTSTSENITSNTSTTTKTSTTTNNNTSSKTYPKVAMIDGNVSNIGKTSNGYSVDVVNGVYYIDGYIMANKTYALPSNYYPTSTYKSAKGVTSVCNSCLVLTVYNAAQDMINDASKEGLNIWIQSGYRPYISQKTIYERYVANDGVEKADSYSSRPGHSDHQTGFAFDLNSIDDSFGNTKEGKWVNDNCWKYGFIIRFPKNKKNETGYQYESWHLRYVGTELAEKLYNNGNWLSMEGYFGITSSYDDKPIGS